MTAAAQLDRIVSLVAELSRAAREDEGGQPLATLGRRYGVQPRQITEDIRTLTTLCDHADADWLLSVHAWQQEDRVSVSSHGPFRRPVKLLPDEALALQVALAMDPQGKALAAKLATTRESAAPRPAAGGPGALPVDLEDLFVTAAAEHRRVEILYAGEGDRAGRQDVIEPHEVVSFNHRTYVHAWAEQAAGWRHFRLDRFLDAIVPGGTFTPRDDFQPMRGRDDLFRAPAAAVDAVRVRFTPRIARWIRERYPRHEDQGDGSVVVTFTVTSVDWLVGRVLEYGADAEVLEPRTYREAVRRAVA
jgi:predicted DNA-binding transcriptional regulator YafY